MAKGSNHFDILAIEDIELAEAIEDFENAGKSYPEIVSWEIKRFVEAHLFQDPNHHQIQEDIIRAEELLQQMLSVTENNERQSEFKSDLIRKTFQNIEPSLSLVEKILDRAKREMNMGDA
tara:strand:+ start:46 stop:405 length:360 start_codon:yes stop_codon:yes gene_type:complete